MSNIQIFAHVVLISSKNIMKVNIFKKTCHQKKWHVFCYEVETKIKYEKLQIKFYFGKPRLLKGLMTLEVKQDVLTCLLEGNNALILHARLSYMTFYG